MAGVPLHIGHWLLLISVTGIVVLVVTVVSKDYMMDKVMGYPLDFLGITPGSDTDVPRHKTLTQRHLHRSNTEFALASPAILKLQSMFGLKFLPPKTLGLVIATADTIRRQNKGRPVLVALVNNAFVPFTLNWLCNTEHMLIHNELLLIAVDEFARINLSHFWPNVKVISLGINRHKNGQTYGKAGYTKLLVVRAAILSVLVSSGIELVHFETDALWLQNPLPDLLSFKNYDVIAQTCYERDHYPLGFLYLNKTLATRDVINNMTAQLAKVEKRIRSIHQDKPVSEAEMDQPILTDLIKRYPGIRTKRMDYFTYPDGMWYSSEQIRNKSHHPLMIQNNWIKSVGSKVKRAKKWKHWFLGKQLKCNASLVKDIVYDFK